MERINQMARAVEYQNHERAQKHTQAAQGNVEYTPDPTLNTLGRWLVNVGQRLQYEAETQHHTLRPSN